MKDRTIVLERVEKLFELAKKESNLERSRRYIKLAREIASKAQIKVPLLLRRSFCRKCNTPYSKSSKVRIKNGFVNYICTNCGSIRRFKLEKK
ncbi:MAG: hypothetical protein AABX59_02200 [Nanoarchaeota archaeon]